MKKVLIIGYGNTLRGDDAAGIHAAEIISKHHPEFTYLCMHQLMPEMAEQIAECDIVFFLDADVNAVQPESRQISPNVGTDQPRTHFLSPESLLSLSQQLYQRMPSAAYTVGIPASNFEFSEQLSELTAHAVEECVRVVEQTLVL